MKIVDIITSDMHQLHGANKVTEKLILGREYFKENGFLLRYVISQDGIINCADYSESQLGLQLETAGYKNKRILIEKLKNLPFYRTAFIQKCILDKEILSNSRVCRFVKSIRQRPDIIIYQDPFTAIYYLKKNGDNTKSIFISRADTDPFEQLFLGRPSLRGTKTETELRNSYRFLVRHVNSVVTICQSSQNYMKRTYGTECPCIINGIEDIPLNDGRKYSSEDHKIHIAIVASIQYRKGQDLALDALAALPGDLKEIIILHIFGGGDGLDKLKRQHDELKLGNSVKLYGPVLDVEKHLPLMDAFLLPSRADTVPIAIIEAMRAGLPIFATRVGEVEGMIAGCGALIEPTIEAVLNLYKKLIYKKYNLEKLGYNSRNKFLEEFQLSSMIKKYSDVMKKISDKSQS